MLQKMDDHIQDPLRNNLMGKQLTQPAMGRIRILAILPTVLWLTGSWISVLSGSDDIVREQRPDSWRQDAAINDVCFVDPQRGWAVGDQGLILRTTDGGQNWFESGRVGIESDDRSLLSKLNRMQPVTESVKQNPIRCQLNSVHFVDSMNGWIAGSYTIPYVGRSRAIVMKSKDGGVTWLPIEGVVLPKISRLNFQSHTHGWAIGQAGSLYKTGIFYTNNGGQSWSTEGAKKLLNWRDADPIGGLDLVTVSQTGKLGVVRSSEYEPSVILSRDRPNIRAVRMLDEKNGWAAGDNGTLLSTQDGGASWRPVDTSALPGISGFDFSSLTLVGDRLYVAGNPGTYVFSLATQTGELQRHRTPIKTDIRKIHFASATHGWAVGSLGSILATRDAGLTWAVQRSGADRVGALMMSVHPRQLPLEMMARFSSEENILSTALCLTAEPKIDVRSATSRLGCSMAQTLPPGTAVTSQEMIRHLVRAIRTLEPNVVVVNEDPSGQVNLIGLMRDAISKASDRNQFVTQLTENGLNTWQVERLVFTTPQHDSEINVDSKKLLPRIGHLVEDYIAISRAQLGLPIRHGKQSLKRYTYENYGATLSVRDSNPFVGLNSSGPEVPRRHGITRMGNLNAINRASAKQRQFDYFLSWETKSTADLVYWRRQIQGLGLGLEPAAVGVWMTQLADQYVELGKPEMAAYTLELMVNRVGDHALMPSALLWLAQYYSSDEFHWQFLAKTHSLESPDQAVANPAATRSVARNVNVNGTKTLIWEPLPEEPDDTDQVVQASYEPPADDQADVSATRKQRLELASRFLSRLKRFDPDLGLDPRIRFLEAQILQKMQGPAIAKNQFRALIRASNEMDPIASAASREMVLADNRPLPADRIRCKRADSRPKLDGQLDDALWQNTMSSGQFHLRELTVSGKVEAVKKDIVMLAYDDEFLFVAARCNKIPGQSYQVSRVPRKRDADLSLRDRLEITLDLDRDYRSSYRFVIDHRGWAGDCLGGSSGWNPQWFIDQSQDDDAWIIELAIPFSEITKGAVEPGTVMAARVNRLSYDSSSLWTSEQSRQVHANAAGGLMECLIMQPNSLQLIEFEQ